MSWPRLLWLNAQATWAEFRQRHLCRHRRIATADAGSRFLLCLVCGRRWTRRPRGANDWATAWEAES